MTNKKIKDLVEAPNSSARKQQGKINWKYVLVVVGIAVLAGAGTWVYCCCFDQGFTETLYLSKTTREPEELEEEIIDELAKAENALSGFMEKRINGYSWKVPSYLTENAKEEYSLSGLILIDTVNSHFSSFEILEKKKIKPGEFRFKVRIYKRYTSGTCLGQSCTRGEPTGYLNETLIVIKGQDKYLVDSVEKGQYMDFEQTEFEECKNIKEIARGENGYGVLERTKGFNYEDYLPPDIPKDNATCFTADFNDDGQLETFIIGFYEGWEAGVHYAVFENEEKIASLDYNPEDKSGLPNPRMCLNEKGTEINFLELANIDDDQEEELFLDMGCRGERGQFQVIVLDVNISGKEIEVVKLVDKNGEIKDAVSYMGATSAMSGHSFQIKDLDGDGRKEVIELEDGYQRELEEWEKSDPTIRFEEKYMTKHQRIVYQWNRSLLAYNEGLSMKVLQEEFD